MKFSYVLPDPNTYQNWCEFEADLACMKSAGYDAVELQIAEPAIFDEDRIHQSLDCIGYTMCTFQTGSTYASRGNCLCVPDEAVRRRTIDLLKSFVDLASRWNAIIVFGSLQGRLSDEPNRQKGEMRIRKAIQEVGEYAASKSAIIAFEPVNHLEVGFHNTIAEVKQLATELNIPSVKIMVDTFHMNIEESDMLAPLAEIQNLLVHVHLSETNRDAIGTGHWPTVNFLAQLAKLKYDGYCSVGVYHTQQARHDCITFSIESIKKALQRSVGVFPVINRPPVGRSGW